MSIKTPKRLVLGVIASLVFAPLAVTAPASAAITAETGTLTVAAATVDAAFGGTSSTAAGSITYGYTAGATSDTVTMTASVSTTVTGATATVALGAISSATNATAPLSVSNTVATVTPAAAGAVAGTHAVTLTANRAGVYVVTITPGANGIAAGMTAKTITFTLSALYAVTADGLSSGTASKSTANGVAGPANTVTLAVAEQGTTPRLVTISGAGAKTTTATGGDLTVANDGLSIVVAAGTSAQANNFVVQTPTVGTVTVSVFEESAPGIYSATALNTVTITVNAAAITNVFSAAKSTSYVGSGNTVSTTAAAETTVLATPIRVAATLSTTDEAANVQVIQKDGNGTNLTSGFKTVTASITGGGLLGTAVDTPTGASVSSAAAATTTVYVFPNGTSGNATLTVSLDGTVVETLTVSFYGAVASLVATSKISSVNADGGALAGVIEVVARDANSILVPGATVTFDKAADATLVSTMTAAADGDNDGDQLVGITPIAGKYGTTTVTVKSGTVISNAVTVVLAHNEVATATLALDKTTYLPGEKATLTLAAKDKNGLIVPDALDAAGHMAFTSNLGLSAAFGTGTAAWVAGSYTQTIFAPQTTTPTDWIITVKLDTDAAFATALDGATLTAATVKVGFPVVVPEVVYEKPTLSFVVSGGRVFLSGTAEDGEGDIIIYVKRVGTTAWKERAKTLEVAAPGDFNGSIKAPKGNVVIRVKQEGTGLFSNQVIIVK